MKQVYTKIIENPENIFWIMKKENSNKSNIGILRAPITNIKIINTVVNYSLKVYMK